MKCSSFRAIFTLCLILGSTSAQAEFEVRKEKFDNGVVSKEYYFKDTQLVEERHFDIAGRFSGWSRYSYLENGHTVRINLSVEKEDYGQITSKLELSNLDSKNRETESSILFRKWVYSDEAPRKLLFIERYETQTPFRVIGKDYENEKGQALSSITFSYASNDRHEKPTGFVEVTPDGKIKTRFSMYEPYDLVQRLRSLGKSEEEIRLYKRHRENPGKFLIGIIDSGFDYNHAALVTKWWNNPDDPIDGKDNDGNGWVDDNFGWEQVKNVGLPTESSTSFQRDDRPLSHGTHVAHIAIGDLTNAALVGFAGDYTQASYIDKISAFLKKHKVRIVNLSIGFPPDTKDLLGLRDGIKAYRRMIDENPETLFVVAAGNESLNIDDRKNRQYPASFEQPNVLKVGALDAADFSKVTPANAKMADFSNYGSKTVDILAPGAKVVAASIGGGLIAHSGTSMATPFMVHEVAKVWMELPHLSAVQIRQLFIETAQVMTPEAPVLSKGYADTKAALLKGRIDFLKNSTARQEGPNCWNSSTLLAGLSQGVHHTFGSEFAFLIESPLCQSVNLDQLKAGDIVAFRRVDQKGRLLPAAFLSEVHGYTYLENKKGFTKNGVMPSATYQEQSTEEILNFYRSSEGRNCKLNGLDRKDCILKEFAYRCTDIETYMSTQGGLNIFEKDVLLRLSSLEKHLQAYYLHGQEIQFDKDSMLKKIQSNIDILKSQGSKEFVIDYFEMRAHSLDYILKK
ncbi:serine protease [Bdellovibrio bacteriovorus]|uniref:Serine protease n=1 Tax=Bdellovibrio bacteriovorus TaxID=959 RepID=A0A150WI84_BDEBC|nr:S8 family serine peptidase [Bdellovibrio bacteriovorus]KYG63257.1 serine protease [Bdellovibrio bacteriovorus]